MVRRWSCVININNNFNKFYNLEKNFKINVFKASVNFKKFTFNYTKFKRKSLIRIKHKSNFLIYTNVIKTWVKDYLFHKNYLKFQFFNKIFTNNFYFLNLAFIKIKNDEFRNNYNFFFSNFTNKNNNYFFSNKKINFFKYTTLSTAHSDLTFDIKTFNNLPILPIYSSYDNNFFPTTATSLPLFDINSLFELFNTIFLKKVVEIRKIITLLFFINLKNF